MLGHGDVFHHTNMDTPDKCDPTELKRITSLALATCLFLANADDADAFRIAREVYHQARKRMAQRTYQSIRLISAFASEGEKRVSLPVLFSHVLEYPRLQAEIEAANIRETKELCVNAKTNEAIDSLARRLQKYVRFEEDEIKSAYSAVCDYNSMKEIKYPPNELYKEASQLKPTRLFKGPLPGNVLEERLNETDLKWYDTNREKAGGNSGVKRYEIINLMDGQRTVLNIRHIISCEFGETDLEYVLHFVRDLKKIGLVEF
jgi:hypothetical protein